jgi:hypothetical protein
MAKAKAVHQTDNPEFLKEALLSVEKRFLASLEYENQTHTHHGTHGDGTEDAWRKLLSEYLPGRYKVSKAFAVDHKGNISEQLDCLIYDAHFTAKLWGEDNRVYVPAEAVYAIFEIKQSVNATHIADAHRKAASVRKLSRTSAPLMGPKGKNPGRELSEITAGLLALNAEWKDGLGASFLDPVKNASKEEELQFVITATDGSYDREGRGTNHEVMSGPGSLIRGLFRLIEHLRNKNTVSAVEWDRYEAALD